MASEDELLSTISESSFVILGQGSLPPTLDDLSPGSVEGINSFVGGSLHSDHNLGTNADDKDFFGIDTQAKLNQLLRENFELKETLNQNNLAIKAQLDIFVMWQQEVLKTHESHKQKFLETKELVLKLRAENESLKEQLQESLRKSSFTNNSDSQYFDVSDNGFIKPEQFNNEMEGLKKKIQSYETFATHLLRKNESLISENMNLQRLLHETKCHYMRTDSELEIALKENACLKEKNDQLIKGSSESFNHISLPNAEARAQINNLSKQLEEEREKVEELKKEMQKLKLNTSLDMESKSTCDEYSHCAIKSDDGASIGKESQAALEAINSWVSLAAERFNKQKTDKGIDYMILPEMAQTRNRLRAQEFKQNKGSLLEVSDQFNQFNQFKELLKDYEDLQEKLNALEKNETSCEELKNIIAKRDKELEAKEKECDNLKEEIRKLSLECEELPLLRVQVELYQTDFNDERAAREKLAGEKEEMAEQIRLLESRIKDLEQEKGQDAAVASSDPPPAPSKQKKTRYVCPKCMFSFSDLTRCQTHIEECIDMDFYP